MPRIDDYTLYGVPVRSIYLIGHGRGIAVKPETFKVFDGHVPGFRFEDEDGRTFAGPLSSIIAVTDDEC